MRLPKSPEGRQGAGPRGAPPPPRPRPVARPEKLPPPEPAPAAAAPPTPLASQPTRRRWRRQRPAEAAAARLRALDLPPEPEPATQAAPDAPPGAEEPASEQANGQPNGQSGGLRPLLEGLGLLVLLLLIDLPLTGGSFYAHWPVHPAALPVLYIAARYGLAAGAAIAAMAGVLRLGLALATDALSAGAWAEPLAWPLAAVLVGGLADAARRRHQAAEAAAAAARADRDAIADSNERLAARALELEHRLAARLQAATALFEATRALGQGSEGVVRGATGLIHAATGCAACSFWLAEGRTLHLVAASGWPEGANLAQTFLRGRLPEVMEEGHTLLATRPGDRLVLGEEGILAAPVRSPWDGSLLGMVKIEDIGFAELALDTVATLEAVASWLAQALAEARSREAATTAGTGGVPGILAGEEASQAIASMAGLARRVGFDLALLSAEIPPGPRAAGALEATRAAMQECFRGSDLLLEARLEQRRLSVLLPGSAVLGAETAAARLRALMAARAPAATAQVVVSLAALHRVAPRHG
jgi:hypothetical protein